MINKKNYIEIIAAIVYFMFILFSFVFGYGAGKQIANNFFSFLVDMFKILPCAFVLVGLFEVWVKKETVIKHLGQKSGIKGYIWIILLGGTIVGGLYVAFPMAYVLYNKGAKLSIIFTYIGAAAVCRIPMTIFEASFMGIKFTLIRLSISIPLVILSSMLLGNYLEKKNYKIIKVK